MDNTPTPNPGKKLGKGMWVATWLVGLTMLVMFFAEQEQRWLNPNETPDYYNHPDGSQAVVLKRNRQGHYVVSGHINGKEADFLLDTGATEVVISGNLAKRYGLKRGPASLANTANGVVTVYATRINELSIGNITLYRVNASINPGMNDLILLGMSALKRVELTQRGDTLTLKHFPNE